MIPPVSIGDVYVGKLHRYYRKFTGPISTADEDYPIKNPADNKNEDNMGSYRMIIRDIKGGKCWYESFQVWPDGTVTNTIRKPGETKETDISTLEREIMAGHLVKE